MIKMLSVLLVVVALLALIVLYFPRARRPSVAILCVTVLLATSLGYIPLRDALLGVPFDVKKKPNLLGEGRFEMQVEVPCNRYYDREVGFIIDPPVSINNVHEVAAAITGTVKIVVKQGGKKIYTDVDLSTFGGAWKNGGIWMVAVARYSPMEGFSCGAQHIYLEANGINFDLDRHSVTVYVSRDRRP